ncbi:MAG: glutathionylspermidine synthase, partial [Lachnospiraceae bacterium]|nr:glutathionylspermidine synthase [Lachnospiraceae bacterium]
MKLIPIPKEKYEDYRLNLMFDCYKWDPQYLDHNTVAPYALAISQEEHKELVQYIEALDRETKAAEEYINLHQELAKPLALPKRIRREIHKLTNYEPDKHVRLKRYDFHPLAGGKWAVSEVNSDVPGGYAEGSFMPRMALEAIGQQDKYWCMNFGENLVNAICGKVKAGGRIMLVHCTSYSDDRQV